MIVFLSGKMTGLEDLGRAEFARWERKFRDVGCTVINPSVLPLDLPREKCLPITLAMLDQADTVFMIPGWETSEGANLELKYAEYSGKNILSDVELDKDWIDTP